MPAVTCFSCSREVSFPDRVPMRAECEHCRADVHVCKNCQFYDPKAYNECREPQAENVREKDRANRCEYFQPSNGRPSNAIDPAAALKAAAEALFKKG